MTYSYIKSVFPNYQMSKDPPVYNNISLAQPAANTQFNVQGFENGSMHGFSVSKQRIQNDFKELFTNNNEVVSNKVTEQMPPPEFIRQLPRQLESETVIDSQSDCQRNMSHILRCDKCMMIVKKQLNLEYEKARNEEIMELVSYVLFGIFILMLIENLKGRSS